MKQLHLPLVSCSQLISTETFGSRGAYVRSLGAVVGAAWWVTPA